MTYKNITLQKHEMGVAVLKIARPAALNALNTETLRELNAMLLEIANDASIRVLVFTGEGEKSFIAGADIAEMKDQTSAQGVHFSQLGNEVSKLLETMAKPTIAAVNGYALGGGAEMALACDFIIASEKALFGFPEVSLGMIPGFGGCFRLARYVGIPRAKELIFSGRRIKADEAKALGLCLYVLPQEGFHDAAIAMAKTIAANSAGAVAKAKTLLVEFSETIGLNNKIDAESHAFGRLMSSRDQREGMGAFLEKRKPAFEGLTQ